MGGVFKKTLSISRKYLQGNQNCFSPAYAVFTSRLSKCPSDTCVPLLNNDGLSHKQCFCFISILSSPSDTFLSLFYCKFFKENIFVSQTADFKRLKYHKMKFFFFFFNLHEFMNFSYGDYETSVKHHDTLIGQIQHHKVL